MRIAYQGLPGAFSQLAAREHHAGAVTVPMDSFAAVVRAVTQGTVEAGILPVDNAVIGPITESIAAMAADRRVGVVGEVTLPIHHCLLALPGATLDGIRWIESHPAALAQCSRWLSARRIPPRAVIDTAGAARSIATDRDYTRAAIASSDAAELYGLSIIARDIADVPGNRTRFVVIRSTGHEAAA